MIGALIGGGLLIALLMVGCSQTGAKSEAAASAQTHWLAANKTLETIQVVRDSISSTDPYLANRSIPGWISSLQAMEASATAEIDSTAQALGTLPAGSVKSGYAGAMADGREAIAQSKAVIPLLRVLPKLWKDSDEINAAMTEARGQVSLSVEAANAGDYARALTSAKRAAAASKKAHIALNRFEATLGGLAYPRGEISLQQVREAIKVERALDRACIDVAAAGNARDRSTYERALARYGKAAEEANDASDIVDALSAGVIRTWVTDALDAAGESLAEARVSYGSAVDSAAPE